MAGPMDDETPRSIRSALHAAADALTAHGFAAHATDARGELRIVSEHCPFGDAAVEHPVICAVDRGMVRGLLAALADDDDATPETLASLARGDDVCITSLSGLSTSAAGERSRPWRPDPDDEPPLPRPRLDLAPPPGGGRAALVDALRRPRRATPAASTPRAWPPGRGSRRRASRWPGSLDARPREVVFTSGATESIAAVCWGAAARGGHQVLTAVEHSAVAGGRGPPR